MIFAHLSINDVRNDQSEGEFKCLQYQDLVGGRSQDRTVDLLLVRQAL
jgi:hypothetical protein